jgi:very-short-patch-repair endonuclease
MIMNKKDARQLRKESTSSEVLLWKALRGRQFEGLKFRRQHPIEGFIVDFCCVEFNLVIEIDGDVHYTVENQKRDGWRQQIIEQAGFTVVRFTTEEIINHFDGVLDCLYQLLEGAYPHPNPLPQAGEGTRL